MKHRSILLRLSVLAISGAGLAALAALGSCTADGPGVLGNGFVNTNKDNCATPNTGCACDGEGLSTSCGEVVRRSGDYVTCSEGKRTCQGGKWGACIGDSVHVKGAPITLGGQRVLGLQQNPTQCQNNPCDPDCTNYEDDGIGLDAAGLTLTDSGGTTLQETGPTCVGLQCQQVTCDGGGTTTVTGTVRDPAGANPIYNATVYVPNAAVAPFTPGVSADQCGSAGFLSGNPIVVTQTAADGTFTLSNVPAGSNIPLVIQIGRWRRQITIPTVTACTANALAAADTRLPKNQGEGDIPKMAIASGGCDPLECLIQRIGIDSAEFTVPSGTGRIGFYQANGGMPLASGGTPWWDTLMTSQVEMNKYDLVFLPCQCGNEYSSPPTGSHDVLRNFAAAGGRIFTSHWGREWIENGPNPVFPGVANWGGATYGSANPLNVYVDTTTPNGVAFAAWMTAAGATNPFSQSPSRFDVQSVIAPTQRTAYAWSDNNPAANPGAPDNVTDMKFDTPLGVPANQQVGRVVFADTHVSGNALNGAAYQFPDKCASTALSAQEKALEFLIFDLSACVGPTAPVVPPYPNSASFVRDYEGICPAGKGPVWHFFDWKTHTPSDSSIAFTVQTADTQGALGAATSKLLATVSGAPILNWTGADVDTVLQTIPSKSKTWLRVTITLNPSSDKFNAPVLDAWRQAYDCVDNQ